MNDTDIMLAGALASRDALISTLIDAIEEARYLIAGYIDAKDDEYHDALIPNDAMRADQLLEVVIAKAKRARQAQGGAK